MDVIVAILVLIFIQPILKLIWQAILWLGTYVYDGLSDSVYRSAALGNRNYLDVFFLFLLTASAVGTASGLTLARGDGSLFCDIGRRYLWLR